MQVLGLDIGNAKVKSCWIHYQEDLEHSQIAWDSQPLPSGSDRRLDFAMYLNLLIQKFLVSHDIQREGLSALVVCCSHSFSYPEFHESIRHLAELLARNDFSFPVYLLRADGELTSLEDLEALSDSELYAYTFTNFYGSAYLASKLIRNGLSLDLGTTTLDIIPIQAGKIDPEGLAKPADYLRYRYSHGRIHWLGLTTTHLTQLAERVPLGNEVFQVVPRHYRSDLLFGLVPEAERTLISKHAYGHFFPSSAQAHRGLAEYVGLDTHLLNEAQTQEIRDYLYGRMLDRVASEIQTVAKNTFAEPIEELEICAFALGEELVLRPALERAGIRPAQICTLQTQRAQQLWSASSVFAMALKGLEHVLGQSIPLHTAPKQV